MGNSDVLITIKEVVKGDILVLHITGRLDAVSSPHAEHTVFDFINKGQHKLILNFAGVDYLSSAGMRMLLSITKKLKSIPGKLVLCSLTTNVMDVLRMSGFDHVLEITITEDEAFRRF